MSVLLFWHEEAFGQAFQDSPTVTAIGGSTSPPYPLGSIIPSYLYQQYADDANLQAFVAAYNEIAQDYLDWFNQFPLSVYTNPNISGPLLDWVMTGIYGIERPVFSSLVTRYLAGINAYPINTVAVNGHVYLQSGTATIANDDFYKRVGTWTLYRGDGKYFNTSVLRNKVARFLYGANGTDIDLSQAQSVHIVAGPLGPPAAPTLSSVAGGTIGAMTYGVRNSYITANNESFAGAGAELAVASHHLLVVNSPAAELGALAYNIYMRIVPAGPFHAGINSRPINCYAVNSGSINARNVPVKQNPTPIPIGTNWTEPTSGWQNGAPLPSTVNTTGFIILIPPGTASTYFQQAVNQGILPLPFMLNATVVIT